MTDEAATRPVAIYLRDERYGMRAPVPADAEVAGAWYEGAFPISSEAARAMLVEQEAIAWGGNPVIRLIAVEPEPGTIVGGAVVERQDNRVGKLQVTTGGPDRAGEQAQRLRAALLRLLVPWAMGELNMMTLVIDVPADETMVIDAARELGLLEVARLREHILRTGRRVDLLMLERVNARWGRGDA